jgi:hypothetical protein
MWAAGKLRAQAPLPEGTLQLLLAAAAAVAPRCTFAQLTAIGVGLRLLLLGSLGTHNHLVRKRPGVLGLRTAAASSKRRLHRLRLRRLQLRKPHLLRQCRHLGGWQQHAKRRLEHSGQYACSSSSDVSDHSTAALADSTLEQAAADMSQLQHVHGLLWEAWFARSTQLLLQANAAAAGAKPASESASGVHGEQQQQQQQRQLLHGQLKLEEAPKQPPRPSQQANPSTQPSHTSLGLSSSNVSMHLCVAATLWLRPSPVWLQAMLGVLQSQMQAGSPESLSWLLRHVSRLQHRVSGVPRVLPQGFVQALLDRVRVLRGEGEAGLTRQQMLRLQRGFRGLRRAGAVSEREWRQWHGLLSAWRVSHGMYT